MAKSKTQLWREAAVQLARRQRTRGLLERMAQQEVNRRLRQETEFYAIFVSAFKQNFIATQGGGTGKPLRRLGDRLVDKRAFDSQPVSH